MQQFFAIVFVLLALWAAVLFLRRKGVAVLNAPLRKQVHLIQQLDRLRLTPQHSIYLLQIEDRRIAVAVHTHGITILESNNSTRTGAAQ